MAVAVDCIDLLFHIVVTPNDTPPGTGQATSDDVHRVTLGGFHILHVIPPVDNQCFELCVERVVKCRSGCVNEEFKWDFPIGCGVIVLPPGTYDISFPEQLSYPIAEGELELGVMLEPITHDVVEALKINCS